MNHFSSMTPTPPQADPPSPSKTTSLPSQNETNGTSDSFSDSPKDVAFFSTDSEEVSHFLKQMSQIPDMRQSRVTQIQEALESGSYLSSSEKLADKILQEFRSLP